MALSAGLACKEQASAPKQQRWCPRFQTRSLRLSIVANQKPHVLSYSVTEIRNPEIAGCFSVSYF